MEINNLQEAKQVGPAMLVTGALNPYTLAHEEMAGLAMKHAHETGHTHFYHGIGSSELKPDAPLTHAQKTKIVSASHTHLKKTKKLPIQTSVIPKQNSISPFHQVAHLISKGHKDITVALGSDQLAAGGLKSQIESHMKKHGGFIGLDKKPHKVNITFHQLGGTRHEGEISREQIIKEITTGNLRSVKAGRLRSAVQSGDFELASAMMPSSIKDKKSYFALIAKQQETVNKNKKTKKKKITEEFSPEKIQEFSKMLNEAIIVKNTIEQRKNKRAKISADLKRRHAETMLALMIQQRSQRESIGTSPELRQQQKMIRNQAQNEFVAGKKNAMFNITNDFSRKIINAKIKEVKLGLDKLPHRVGSPKKPRQHTIKEMINMENLIEQAKKKSSDKPSKTIRKVRTEVRSANRGATGNKKDTIRKQEERRENKKSPQYAVIVRKEGNNNKIKIVKKEDIKGSTVLIKPEQFDKNKAKKYLDDSNFEITDSSKKLFPEFTRKSGGKKKKDKKTKDKKAKKKVKKSGSTLTKKDPREVLPPLPKAPPKGKTRTTPKSQYEDWDHSSLELEAAIPVLLNQVMKVAGIDPKLEKKMKEKFASSKTLQSSAMRAVQQIQEQFGDVIGYHMGAAKTKLSRDWEKSGGTDSTPKTDIVFIPKDEWKRANGKIENVNANKCFRASMKVGASRILNAEGGEAAATVDAAFGVSGNLTQKDPNVKKAIKEIKDTLLKFAKSAETGIFEVGQIQKFIQTGEAPDGQSSAKIKKYQKLVEEQNKLKDFVANKFREIFEVSDDFKLAMLRESMTGSVKFGEKNLACANYLLAMNKDGTSVKMDSINDGLLRKVLKDIKIRGAFKGRSRETKQGKFRGFSTIFNIDYTPRLHEQIEPTEDLNFPNAEFIIKNELDVIGDNIPALMEFVELEPESLTSNELDLTDYIDGKARGYNEIVVDGQRIFSIPVQDYQQFEEVPQEINEEPYEFLNNFIVENLNDDDALDLMLTSGLLLPQTISNVLTKLKLDFEKSAYADLLSEMWETSLLRPDLYEAFVKEARNYKKEYKDYHSKPEQRSNRSKRVLARRKLMKKGRVRKGDGKDVHHEDGNPQNNGDSNLKVLSKSKNRAIKEEHGAGEVGTDALRKKYIQDTPFAIDPLKVLRGVVKNGIRRK